MVPALEARIVGLEAEATALRAELRKAKTRAKWLTLAEAAEELRCSEKTVTRMLKAGKLRRNLDYYRVLIPAEDVDRYTGRVTVPLSGR